MACPITVSKFVGTVSLGLLTGVSYATAAVTLPALQLLPTSVDASHCLKEVKRLNRKHVFQLTALANTSLLFAYTLSSPRRKHPFILWMSGLSALSSVGLDFFFNRHLGFQVWIDGVCFDTTGMHLLKAPTSSKKPSKKDEDVVVVDYEELANGESVQRAMKRETRLQRARAWVAGLALSVGIVGLWGDRSL
ncbi:hypothetical protein N7492_000232 [Penicillium capsulatum]|uniref:Uncharacterized protein n=1 Tax=Penicillium capsulatum TaxID=69766 RepID=A0A9W9ISD2_9EURO|nr:hypothetical protein N7492_000232 [Penicillium capsulatum]KAJ6130702.1 hypothetical protein N7512_003482 [Penicillium capsulatum]